MARGAGRVTKVQSRKAAREWRRAEALIGQAAVLLEEADEALLAGELATRHRSVVRDLIEDVRNARSNVGYAAAEEERAAAR